MATGAEEDGAVDFGYLEGFCAGDQQVIAEVLATFREQAVGWVEALAASDVDQREVAHTIKGSALGIGARRLGEAASRAEFDGPEMLGPVRVELEEAIAAIEGYLTRIGGG
ncbi:Hpt domain-containing protein [Phenylobacterium sp. VNQ135]|uniref:Hpt domain-containing protein n=1 Tax=Phenylobacterium sp. VNQ135 TaxID=3400922 RepID=UPI003C043199